jgi:hypothetical protein
MPEILLVNPRKGRMPAGLRRYWASKHRRRRRPAASAASTPRRKRRRRINPRGHRKIHRRRLHARPRTHAGTTRPIRRRRRNPRFKLKLPSIGGLKHAALATVVPAASGAAGALVLDVVWGYASAQTFMPEGLKQGWGAFAVKMAGALGIGWALEHVLPKPLVRSGVLGAATVITYNALRDQLKNAFPNVKGLGGYADYTDYALMSSDRNVGAYMPGGAPGMGAYMPGGGARLGFYNPAPLLDGGYSSEQVAAMHGYGPEDGM